MRSLNIAVLGPSFGNPRDPGANKRLQIRDTLRGYGHDAFFPEERLRTDEAWIVVTRDLLAKPNVHLVIILQLEENRTGVNGELIALVLEETIMAKTAVLVPKLDHGYERGLLDNSLNQYRLKVPYTQEQFRDCNLLDDCREIVADLLSEDSPLVLPHGF